MSSGPRISYEPLSSEPKPSDASLDAEDVEDAETTRLPRLKHVSKRQRVVTAVTIVSLTLNLLAALYLSLLWTRRSSYIVWRGAKPLYSK